MHSGTHNIHAFPHTPAQRNHQTDKRHQKPPVQSPEQVVEDDTEPAINELVKAGEVLIQLAERHKNTKNNAFAEVCYLRALDVFSKALPSDSPRTALTRDSLATLYRQRGQLSVAESLQRTAVADLRRHYGSVPHQHVAATLRNLAETCLLGGKIQEGLKVLADAMQVTRELSVDQADHVVEIHRYHAQVMQRLG